MVSRFWRERREREEDRDDMEEEPLQSFLRRQRRLSVRNERSRQRRKATTTTNDTDEEEGEVGAKMEIPSSFFLVKEGGEKICHPTMTEYRRASRSLTRVASEYWEGGEGAEMMTHKSLLRSMPPDNHVRFCKGRTVSPICWHILRHQTLQGRGPLSYPHLALTVSNSGLSLILLIKSGRSTNYHGRGRRHAGRAPTKV